ncbi:hypothetical protein [uncultured Cohaesibacter sp.]|uniref:hypothetical protein n=1 Tax=uncultured Cohaesibacter sp. TaxID=1002546 RepID=UPI0029C65AAB|nr:hypothetical protein [uncultured Cohaesibacter sp.]
MKKSATVLSALAIATVALSAPAFAAGQVDSHNLTGTQVKQMVQDQGSVLISTGPDQFDRYVANDSYCFLGDAAKAAFIPTADSSASLIGYTCVPAQNNNS